MNVEYEPGDAAAPNAHRAHAWRRYLRFFGARIDDDVDDELRFHFDMLVRDLMSRGMTDTEARAAAARRVGDLASARRDCLTIGHRKARRAARANVIEALRQDLAFGFRTLARQRAWTAVIVLTLALGIGASAAIFSVVNTLVLRPFNYPHADRVYLLWRADAKSGMMIGADDDLVRAAAAVPSIAAVEEFASAHVTIVRDGEPSVAGAEWIGRDLPTFAGARVIAGRTFSADETADSTARVVVLSEGFWRTAYGGRADAIGTTLTIDGQPYSIIGVLSSDLRVPAQTDRVATQLWLPYVPHAARGTTEAMVRLRAGVSRESAERALAVVAKRYTTTESAPLAGFTPKLVPPGHFNGLRDSLVLLSVAVALLLVIACANAAHLLLARSASRERELAVRRALGASAGRVARQLLTESALLLLIACAAGLALARLGLSAFVAMRPASEVQLAHASLDWRVVAVSVAVTAATGLLLGALSAGTAVRRNTLDALKSTAAAGSGNRRAHRLRAALVVTEMALSAMMLVGALLLVRSVINLQRTDPGFDVAGLYAMPFQFSPRDTRDSTARSQFARDVLEGAKSVPGVRAATLANVAPPMFTFMLGQIELDDGSTPRANDQFNAVNYVRHDFLATLGIPLVAGREFGAASGERHEVIVNEGLARRFWPSQSALGRRLRFKAMFGLTPSEPWMTVVGVTNDAVVHGLGSGQHDPFIYLPSETGTTFAGFTLLVRANPGAEASVLGSLHRLSLALDRAMAPPQAVNVGTALNDSIASQRFTMAVLSIFALLAVVLAAVGLYGVISYLVARRTREIGIRIAIGASRARIARDVLMSGIPLSIVGLAIGLASASLGSAMIRKSLYGVGPNDPLSFVTCAALLLGVAIVACAVPIRRAVHVDPLIAMRAE